MGAFAFPAEVNDLFTYILDELEEAVHIVDLQGRTIVYNRAASLLDDLPPEEVVGAYILDVFPSLTLKTSTLLSVLDTGLFIQEQQQSYVTRKSKQIITMNKTFPLVYAGRMIGAVEVARDITSVKALSDQVLDLHEQINRPRIRKRSSANKHYQFTDIVTQCPLMQREIQRAKRAAKANSPVLVVGETGTGKELFIQSIHSTSPRREKPFIAQNCAAIPAALLEGILFGTVKGAFTGAEDRPGLFELAHGGTLFLDEIQAMPLDLQAKLLRVLEEGVIRRVGGMKTHAVDVRILVATNEDPLESIQQGRLRKDLFYRIHVISIQLPSLRNRKGDIVLLTHHFLHQLQESSSLEVPLSKEVSALFEEYAWPGNVRELKHTIEGAFHIADGPELTMADFPLHLQERKKASSPILWEAGVSLKEQLQRMEHSIIQEAMNASGGNVMRAAKQLGIPRQTLQYKLRRIRD